MKQPAGERPIDDRARDDKDPSLTCEAAAWLGVLCEFGLTTIVGEAPLDRSRAAQPEPKRSAEGPAAREPARQSAPPRQPAPTPQPSDEAAQEAARLARSCADLDSLKAAMEGFEGCALKFTARHLVFLDGLPQADVVFIGEAPGRDEDREGRPFVGRSGKLLDAMVQAMGLERGKQAAITNLLPWRPPGNRTPSRQELLICRPFLDRQIDLVQPRLIVALGGAAAGELSGLQEGIKSLRKRELSVTTETATYPMLATFHPAYLLRQPAAKAEAWRDCLNVMDKLKSLAAGESAV